MGKTELIKDVEQLGAVWDAVAQSDAIEAVRNADNPDMMNTAKRSLSRAEACGQMASKVIDSIHANWPS